MMCSRCILIVELIEFADRTDEPVRGVKSDCVTSMELSWTRTGKTMGGAALGSRVRSH